MRDWISEMHKHTKLVKQAIDKEQYDTAWRLAHEFQDWCMERIQVQNYDRESAGTLLSAPRSFMVKVLIAEKKYQLALVNKIYEGVIDGRNLKHYHKSIENLAKKCQFKNISVSEVSNYYLELKNKNNGIEQSFVDIRDTISKWAKA